MCDIIWCKKEKDGKPCDTVNYLDPYCFWNWEGKIACADCGTVYYIHMIQGHMYAGPDEKAGGNQAGHPARSMPISPWMATCNYPSGMEGRTRPYHCLPRQIYLGKCRHGQVQHPGQAAPGLAAAAAFRRRRRTASASTGILKNSLRKSGRSIKEKIAKGEVKDW